MKAELFAQIFIPTTDGEWTLGTAYPIAEGLVITARHVVFPDDRDASTLGEVVWPECKTSGNPFKSDIKEILFSGDKDIDIAVVVCDTPPQVSASLILSAKDPVAGEAWDSFGYPRAGENKKGIREEIPDMGKFFSQNPNKLKLHLTTEGIAITPELWKGMSGALVFNRKTGKLVGVISEVPKNFNGRLYAVSIPYLLRTNDDFKKAVGYLDTADTATCLPPKVKSGDVNEPVTLANFIEHWTNWSSSKLEFYDADDLFSRNMQVDSPLEEGWKNFIQAQPWRAELLEAIDAYKQIIRNPGFEEMPSSLPDINGSYEKVQEKLEVWIKNVKLIFDPLESSVKHITRKTHSEGQMSKDIVSLQGILSFIDNLSNKFKARLRIGFLIFGAQGSGKTQFFRTRQSNLNYFERGGDNHKFIPLLLPLEPWSMETNFEKVILTHVNEASGGYCWQSLDELDTFFSANKLKLVVMIDDFSRVLRSRTMIQHVRTFMITHTKLDSIFYLFTVQDTNLDVVIEKPEQKLWKLLSYDFYHTACMAGWINLTDLNRQHKIGFKILKAANEDDTAELLEKHESLDSPLLAQLVLELIQTENIDMIASLNFIKFLEIFWEKLKIRENWNDDQVNELISCVICAVFDSSSITPPLNDIKKRLKEKNLPQSEDLYPLKNLKDTALIRINSANKDILGRDKSDNNIQLNYTFFWNGFLAKHLRDIFNPVSDTQQQKAIDWLLQVTNDKTIREGIWEFVLLLTDDEASDKTIKPERARKLWLLAFDDPYLFCAPCFAARWASKYTQIAIARALVSGRQPIGLVDREALFALMFFAIETPALDPQTRFKLLRPYYRDIYEMGLADYFKYGASKILKGLERKSDLYSCLSELANSHFTGCARELASNAWDVFVKLHGKWVKDNLETLMFHYLLNDKKNAIEEYKNWGGKGRRPLFFREELISQALYWAWRQPEGKSVSGFFKLLKDVGWYHGVTHNIIQQIAYEMRSEANLSFGKHFRWFWQGENVKDVDEYKMLVNDLLNGKIHDLKLPEELGYFMLRHSGCEQEKSRTTLIPPCLWDEFEVATKIPTLRRFFESHPIKKAQ